MVWLIVYDFSFHGVQTDERDRYCRINSKTTTVYYSSIETYDEKTFSFNEFLSDKNRFANFSTFCIICAVPANCKAEAKHAFIF